jgi:maleamate amidohydrolase
MSNDVEVYRRQSFGSVLEPKAPVALLIVDFVNGFANPDVFGGGNIAQAIETTVGLLAYARQRSWPIAFSRIVFADDDADHNIFTLKVPGLLALKHASPESAVVPQLTPDPGELVVCKTVPSAFFGTSLAAWLTQRGVQTLVVAGAVTSGCVRASVVDAMQYGFRPFVVSDCVGDRSIAPHDANLFDMAQKYATVVTCDELMEALSGSQ